MRLEVSRRLVLAGAALGFAAFAGPAFAQAPVELRLQCYGDGNECEVTQALLDRFHADNKDVRVTMDVVPYKAVLESLPVQLAAGEGPDMARVTDMGGLNKFYLDLRPHLKDPAYWDTNFGPILAWMQAGAEDKGIYGFPTQLTITGPYVNKTLFDQAGVELPGEGATWDEWAEASKKVAEATGTPFAMVMDRSGHRIAGPAISHGAKFFAAEGQPAVVDEGFKTMAAKFVDWHQSKAMPMEVWGGTGGGSYADALEQFTNASVVFYYSGSWQLQRMQETIGDAFDWVVVPNPCGPAGCTGMPGGAAQVAFKHTKHPEQVARVMDFFASEPVYEELMERTVNIPGHTGLMAKGLEYDVPPKAQAALDVFTSEAGKLSPVAFALQDYPFNRALFNAIVSRLTQAIVGEMPLEEAYQRIDQDIAAALATTKQ